MSKVDDGGPAFPNHKGSHNRIGGMISGEWESSATGLSVRDYFAAKANIGENTPTTHQARGVMGEEPPQWPPFGSTVDFEQCLKCVKWWAEAEARLRYVYADAMLKARKQ